MFLVTWKSPQSNSTAGLSPEPLQLLFGTARAGGCSSPAVQPVGLGTRLAKGLPRSMGQGMEPEGCFCMGTALPQDKALCLQEQSYPFTIPSCLEVRAECGRAAGLSQAVCAINTSFG